VKEYVLSYYSEFKCIADKCKHTCCAGWEVNIDEQSLQCYKTDNTDFASTLKSGINFKKSKFKRDRLGRCAFLNQDGLCEIIKTFGEERLCQVCRDHPRFRSFFDDRTEMGLGFCCEEATSVILSYKNKIEPILLYDDQKNESLSFNQKNILEFRNNALKILQDRRVRIAERIKNLLTLCKAEVCESDFSKIVKTFLSFERLDKSWTKQLKNIKNKPFNENIDDKIELFCEQFLVNEIYRHLSIAEDTMWVRARTIGCIFAWWIIKNIYQEESCGQDDFSLLADAVRSYSAEVEYSQKNLDKLFSFSYKFIKL